MMTASTEIALLYEALRKRTLTISGVRNSPSPKKTLPMFRAAEALLPSNSTTGMSVLPAVFNAIAPRPSSTQASSVVP